MSSLGSGFHKFYNLIINQNSIHFSFISYKTYESLTPMEELYRAPAHQNRRN
jgi:hypothetical protein